MAEQRRTIGQILMSFGRIDEADVANALKYQEEHGGYFGEALLGLELVTAEELEWSLASQFDLPYVFPEADSIDPEAVALVTPEWALAHMTLPIMKTADSLTVIVDSPIKTGAVDELEARTDLRLDLALASPGKIRELIRQVYAGGEADQDEVPRPATLGEVFSAILEAASTRFGISVRGPRAWAWYEERGTVHRRPLAGPWMSELQELVSPSPSEKVEGCTRAEWTGHLNRDGITSPMDIRYLASAVGAEYLFRPVQEHALIRERFPMPSAGILSEIRLLARSGSARFIVSTEPAGLGDEIIPYLPALLLDPSWRTIHVTDVEADDPDEVFFWAVSSDEEERKGTLNELRAFHFDVVTARMEGAPEDWARTVLDVASVAFLLWPTGEEHRIALEAGVKWEISIVREDGDRLEWSLNPIAT